MKTIHCVLSASPLAMTKALTKNINVFTQVVEKGEV